MSVRKGETSSPSKNGQPRTYIHFGTSSPLKKRVVAPRSLELSTDQEPKCECTDHECRQLARGERGMAIDDGANAVVEGAVSSWTQRSVDGGGRKVV